MVRKSVISLLVVLVFFGTIRPDGFIGDTLVRTPHGHVPIQSLKKGDEVLSHDFKGRLIPQKIADIQPRGTDSIVELTINEATIQVVPNHLIYVPNQQKWVQARDITTDDHVLRDPLNVGLVEGIKILPKKAIVYTLALRNHHNFCVSDQDVVVHNVAPLILGIQAAATSVWGSLTAAATSLGIGATTTGTGVALSSTQAAVVGGGIIGTATIWQRFSSWRSNKKHTCEVHARQVASSRTVVDSGGATWSAGCPSVKPGSTADQNKEAAEKYDANTPHTPPSPTSYIVTPAAATTKLAAKAPGLPQRARDGFIPPKKWEGEKVKSRKGIHGYPDEAGRVWIPAGKDAHGGEHWDVQLPGGGYVNICPGGHERGKADKGQVFGDNVGSKPPVEKK